MADQERAEDPRCDLCDGVGHLGPATNSPPRDYGRVCPRCKGSGTVVSGVAADPESVPIGPDIPPNRSGDTEEGNML